MIKDFTLNNVIVVAVLCLSFTQLEKITEADTVSITLTPKLNSVSKLQMRM